MTRIRHPEAARCAVAAVAKVLIIGVCILVTASATAAQAQDAPPGDAAKGRQIYLAGGCFTCHGRLGQGGAFNQPTPSLAKTALPFEGFKFQLRSPVRDMPAYADTVMNDQEVADVYAFVQSLPGKRDPKDIPLLRD
jgi:mono/diheme cytochrome c family protein